MNQTNCVGAARALRIAVSEALTLASQLEEAESAALIDVVGQFTNPASGLSAEDVHRHALQLEYARDKRTDLAELNKKYFS